jgi:hypothetical protein
VDARDLVETLGLACDMGRLRTTNSRTEEQANQSGTSQNLVRVAAAQPAAAAGPQPRQILLENKDKFHEEATAR